MSLCALFAVFALVCIFFGNNLLTGIFLLGAIFSYFIWQQSIQNNSKHTDKIPVNTSDIKASQEGSLRNSNSIRNINLKNGNYNESIGGDYINVQGNLININQDFPTFVNSLVSILEKLSLETNSFAELRESIAHDLENSAQHNPEFRRRLNRWKSKLGKNSKVSDAEVATAVVDRAEEVRWNAINKKVEFDKDIYENLETYLKEGDWEKADNETVEVIIKVLSRTFGDKFTSDLEKNRRESKKQSYSLDVNKQGLSSEHIILIPAIHLKYLDKLWTKYSSGRFGFSVQKRIAREIYPEEYYWDIDFWWDIFDYDQPSQFGERVGWQVDGRWIFITDAIFSTNAPVGHLPFQIYAASSSRSYRYRVCSSILKVITERLYN